MMHLGVFSDEIYLEKQPDYMGPPIAHASIPGFIKHVICDGARFHVLSYGCRRNIIGGFEADIRCSEPTCIYNARKRPMIRKSGSASEDDMLALRELDNHGPLAEIDPDIAKGLIAKGYAVADTLFSSRLQITPLGHNWLVDSTPGESKMSGDNLS
jgi:hypothetical protein